MRLCIDGSNLHSGGSRTHLRELLRLADPPAHGFSEVVVWAGRHVLEGLEPRPWLRLRTESVLDRAFLWRSLWQRYVLGSRARSDACDLLFVPGGSFATDFRPVVTMSRNMLPFELREVARYGWGFASLKFLLLRWTLTRSFRRAQGTIFLTDYARRAILGKIGPVQGRVVTIPHGVARRHLPSSTSERGLDSFTIERPFRLVYASALEAYKHQGAVMRAVADLRAEGLPVELQIIGPGSARALAALEVQRRALDPQGQFLHYLGGLPPSDLFERYAQADAAVFASSCENMPNILLEKMAVGLPIACARCGPMPDLLGNAGLYFDPEDIGSIASSLRELMSSASLRQSLGARAQERAAPYSWHRCAQETFEFLAEIARSQGSAASH